MSHPALQEVSVAGKALDRYFHICAFFDSRDEEFSVLGSYYREGLLAGEKALHIVAETLRDDHRRRLGALGVDVPECERSGQLEFTTPGETYLAGGRFNPDSMLRKLEALIATAKARGYPRTRLMGNMNWAVGGAPGSDRLIEYETRVNDVLARTQQPAICVYDTARLSGTTMLDLLRCHPLTLINGAVHENPFFTPPHVFFAELRHRGRSTAPS